MLQARELTDGLQHRRHRAPRDRTVVSWYRHAGRGPLALAQQADHALGADVFAVKRPHDMPLVQDRDAVGE